MGSTQKPPFGVIGVVLGGLLGYFGTTIIYGYVSQSNLSGLLGLWLGLPIGAGVGALIGATLESRRSK